jgi:lipid II:glycine glycyltransferase (peptidoglycan interpeptide bridge formation enzyme)
MEVKIYFEQERLFNHYVASHPNGGVLQTTNWGRLKAGHGWEYYPLAAEDKGKILASALILIKDLSPLPLKLAYSPRGPVFSSPEALAAIWQGGASFCRSKGAVVWKMDPPLRKDNSHWSELASKLDLVPIDTGLDFGGTQPRFVMTLDLGPSCEELLGNMKSKTRYNIRYAQRKEVVVTRVKEKALMDEFYKLLEETAQRDRFTIRSSSYFYTLWDELMEHKLAHLFLARHEGELLAGAILFILNNRAWYVYGASSNNKRNLQAATLIQWEMIRFAKSQGCRVYDFRGVSGNLDPDHPLYGLYRFKEGFGAQLVEYVGEYDLPLAKGGYFLWQRLLQAHRWLRTLRHPN